MTPEDLEAELQRRSAGDWELYRKQAESREVSARPAHRGDVVRREEGWAARWREAGALRFASGSTPGLLASCLAPSARVNLAPGPALAWPRATSEIRVASPATERPPELFEELARLVSAESRGEALLRELTVRRGETVEHLRNSSGLDVAFTRARLDGVAWAVGRRGTRACEARVVFRCEGAPDLPSVARRLADRATLPLSERGTPVSRGEWLLEPSVAAALLAAAGSLFCGEPAPRWVARGQLFSPTVGIVDDAAADAPFDDEGTPTRRVPLVQEGAWIAELRDLTAAARSGAGSSGHGVRPSYRVPPSIRPRRIFFETSRGTPPLDLLSSVRRGLFASALTVPIRVDFASDRFEAEFTGVAIVSGRALGPVAGARASGRFSELLRRITGIGSDRQFFPVPYPAGAPTLLIERASFD
jgi:predicted Zn-dependent protease